MSLVLSTPQYSLRLLGIQEMWITTLKYIEIYIWQIKARILVAIWWWVYICVPFRV